MAEALAASGVLVAAPEFAESLSSPDTTPSYSRPGAPSPANPSASRDMIVATVLSDIIGGRFGINNQIDGDGDGDVEGGKIAIVGQSAGAGTAMSTPGRFARVAIAGFRPSSLQVGERGAGSAFSHLFCFSCTPSPSRNVNFWLTRVAWRSVDDTLHLRNPL